MFRILIRRLIQLSVSLILILLMLITSCAPGGPTFRGYEGPKRSDTETALIVACLDLEGPVTWYEARDDKDIWISSVDGRGWPLSVAARVCVLPGKRALEIKTIYPFHELIALDKSGTDIKDIKPHRGPIEGVPVTVDGLDYLIDWFAQKRRRIFRKWLVMFDVNMGQKYYIVRGPIGQFPMVYQIDASGRNKRINASVHPYYYDKEKKEWYLDDDKESLGESS